MNSLDQISESEAKRMVNKGNATFENGNLEKTEIKLITFGEFGVEHTYTKKNNSYYLESEKEK